MYFEQIKTPGLGCFSYVLGCPASGAMAIVDPRRDIGVYLESANKHEMQITHIFETHVHADHISGARQLQHATGAKIYIHSSAPIAYQAEKLEHGDIFDFGGFKLKVLHTPGHTPNSISLLVSDQVRSPAPAMLLSGDLLFVGDVGRPDLAGSEILDEQIQNLFNSLNLVLGDLPQGLEVYPAHGQGSLCGKGISAKPYTTLGYERVANPVLQIKNFADFKKSVMENLPMRPQSFSHIISTNLKGPTLLNPCATQNWEEFAISPQDFAALSKQGHIILDLRDPLSFGAAHIAGSINISDNNPQAINWIGTVIPPNSSLLLVLDNPANFTLICTNLSRIGYDEVKGYLHGGMQAWINNGYELESLAHISASSLKQKLSEANPPLLIDVRTLPEYLNKHIENSLHLPFEQLLAEKNCPGDSAQEKVVVCQGGSRAAIAASLLQAQGCQKIKLLAGGINSFTKIK